ncbi:MAG TPA: phosphoserine phosphatase SerB [Myxococcales bacterium]|nr:phosphoserine phosphatase SerB [Myxococcales bacterium]
MNKTKDAQDALLITVTGKDQPGISARMASCLHKAGAELLEVEQVVVYGRLIMHWLIGLDGAEVSDVLKELLWEAKSLGVDLDFQVMEGSGKASKKQSQRWAVTLVAPRLGADVIMAAATAAADHGFNIDRIETLGNAALSSIELLLSGDEDADPRALKDALLSAEAALPVDIALQRESLLRRSKRLVVMDMDSTLIQQEVIDEIARIHGVYDEVAGVTERAMRGEIPFTSALDERVKLLKGAPESVFEQVLEKIELTPGAEHFVQVLQGLGYKTAVVSGGFIQVAGPLAQRLGLDYAFANQLEVVEGKLTGKLVGPVVDKQRKGDLLESMAQAERISIEQVIAIGDGANDLEMLGRAGLGIAFNAKKVVQEQADTAINQHDLSAVLYLLGIRDSDVQAVA